MAYSPTMGMITFIIIMLAITAMEASLTLGCTCSLHLQCISQSENKERMVGNGKAKEFVLLVQYLVKQLCAEKKFKVMTPNRLEVHS